MPKEPANGRVVVSDDADNATPFERFETLTKQLLAVPKAELDAKVEEAKRASKRRRLSRSHG